MGVIRVVVVEDSITIRKHISAVLTARDGIEVVGEAGDGKAAIELCERLRPDVVTMDMMLPVMTGLAATEYIMAFCPTPILIVSASTNRGELFKTYDALAAGAVDVLEKPTGNEPDDGWERQLVDTVRLLSRIRVITHPRGRLGRLGQSRAAGEVSPPRPRAARQIVGIGASTGGPGAVLKVLGALPREFPLPILLVIHISEPFGIAMAEWLDAQLLLPVRYARDNERLADLGARAGVLMAPPGAHLVVAAGRLRLTDDPELHFCRPSIDVLFNSLAHEIGDGVAACLLTGMGRDGAAGMRAIRDADGVTVAQDEATSVVFGMPAEAIRRGGATHVLPLAEIGPFLGRIPSLSSRTGGKA